MGVILGFAKLISAVDSTASDHCAVCQHYKGTGAFLTFKHHDSCSGYRTPQHALHTPRHLFHRSLRGECPRSFATSRTTPRHCLRQHPLPPLRELLSWSGVLSALRRVQALQVLILRLKRHYGFCTHLLPRMLVGLRWTVLSRWQSEAESGHVQPSIRNSHYPFAIVFGMTDSI